MFQKMKIPAQIHEIFCPNCGCRIEFPLFMASFYSFETYREIKTKTIVRVDLEHVHNQKLNINELLKRYSETKFGRSKDHKWINLEDMNFCHKCQKSFLNKEGKNQRFCVEERIDAETIP